MYFENLTNADIETILNRWTPKKRYLCLMRYPLAYGEDHRRALIYDCETGDEKVFNFYAFHTDFDMSNTDYQNCISEMYISYESALEKFKQEQALKKEKAMGD